MHRRRTNPQPLTSLDGFFLAELLLEILTRLPVKSLLRFRCVSTTFRSTIDNPSFIYDHLVRYNHKNNHEKLDMLTLERTTSQQINFTTRRGDTFQKSSQHMITSKLCGESCAGVDGLILLWLFDERIGGVRLHLVNPSIRKYLLLPRCPFFPWFRRLYNLYAIGFARSVNDYKVVAFQLSSIPETGPEFAVYGLSDGRWRRRKINHVMDWLSSCPSMQYECVSTKGAAHWLVCCKKSSIHSAFTHIVSFDFDVEEISYLELPSNHGGERQVVWFVFVLGDSVAVLGVLPENIFIWVLEDKDGEGKERHWKKWYTGDSSTDAYNFFQTRSHKNAKLQFFEESSEFLITKDNWNLTWYNIKSHRRQHLASTISVCDMYVQVESLVLSTALDAQTLTSSPEIGELEVEG